MMQKCDDVRSAIVFLIPYRTGAVPKDGLNISLYARVKIITLFSPRSRKG